MTDTRVSQNSPFLASLRRLQYSLALPLLFVVLYPQWLATVHAQDRPVYMYEDTRRLVELVEEAATLVEQKGEKAFAEFNTKGSKWLIDQYYIFVYGTDGTCFFHPIEPELVGKNLMDLRDMDGKPVVQWVT